MVSAHGISLLQQLQIRVHHSLGFELENRSISSWTVQQCLGNSGQYDGRASVLHVSRELASLVRAQACTLTMCTQAESIPWDRSQAFFVGVRKW